MKADGASLHALLLAGGHSRRMGQNKAKLLYQGKTQLARTIELLQQFDIPQGLSLRQDQSVPEEARGAGIEVIRDCDDLQNVGPLGGILSAFAEKTTDPLLVLACDLPFLDTQTIAHLLANRSPNQLATAYQSNHDGLPEPLCAIWEPHGLDFFKQKFGEDIRCPRKILIQGDTNLLNLPSPDALDNINTPEEYQEALARIS